MKQSLHTKTFYVLTSNLYNSYPFLLQGPTGSTSVRYSLFLSQKVGFTTFCIVIAALTLMYNHLVLSLVGRYELCRLKKRIKNQTLGAISPRSDFLYLG